jgi:hypothetical protein
MNSALIFRTPTDKESVMPTLLPTVPARSEILFLEYRLEIVSHWPSSPRKKATSEAISRRLASIARAMLARPETHDLMDSSCRLLDTVFSPE